MTHYQPNYSPEQQQLADHIIGLERAALEKWFNRDVSGYRQLWSRSNFSYFDGDHTDRVDTRAEIDTFLDSIDGKLHAETYDFKNARVQFGSDTALLTFQLYADTNLIDMKYNCIELYQQDSDGQWHVIHSTWSFIRPMDIDFTAAAEII